MKMVDLKKRLLAKGLALGLLGDLVSGLFFGVGYLAIDHFNDWMDAQSPTNPPAQTAGERSKVAAHPQQSRAAAASTTTDRK
jgi:hypothetical protein